MGSVTFALLIVSFVLFLIAYMFVKGRAVLRSIEGGCLTKPENIRTTPQVFDKAVPLYVGKRRVGNVLVSVDSCGDETRFVELFEGEYLSPEVLRTVSLIAERKVFE